MKRILLAVIALVLLLPATRQLEARVDVSVDFGVSWQQAELGAPKNRFDWQRWTATVKVPSNGYYEIWSRATDDSGAMQPHIAGNWNPQGYGGNPFHRIAVLIG